MEDQPSESVRQERIKQFREFVGDDVDEETCAALLASNDWNVEATATNFYEGPAPDAASRNVRDVENEDHAAAARFFAQDLSQADSDDGDDQRHEMNPFLDEPGGMRSRRGRGVSPERDQGMPNGNLNSRSRSSVLPPGPQKSLMSMIKEAVTGQTPSESAASAARRFAAEFDRIVGPEANVPDFFESSFDDALLSASTERRMLVVYLHAPLHPDTEVFCKDILCSRPVINALAEVRVWGGSVHSAEGYLASMKLQAAGFPCLILIATDRGRDARIVDRLYIDDIQEPNLAERFASRIIAARNFRPNAVGMTAVNQHEVDERRRVVEEQNEALRLAMEEDRRREEGKRARERQEEEERRRKEADERRKLEELDSKRQRIRPEPEAGPATATIRFQFPGGQKLLRKFQQTDTVGYVKEVLDVYLVDQLKISNLRYALVLNYPKKTLEDETIDLKEAGLVPQAVLFLQDLDA